VAFSHTFIIPSHNQARYLPGAIDSVLNQIEPISRILISEDYSTDESPAIVADYAARHPDRISVTRPPTHEGMFPNWNWAISQATTDWISVVASDDQALPSFSAEVRRAAERYPRAVLIGGDWDIIDGEDRLIKRGEILSLPERLAPPETFYKHLVGTRVHPAAHAFRKSAWQAVGGFPAEVKLVGDWAFWLLLTPEGEFIHLRKALARYRIDYRPTLRTDRLEQLMKDEIAIQTHVIPGVLARLPGLSPRRIVAARRQRLRETLESYGRTVTDPEARRRVAEILRPWGEALDAAATAMIDAWGRGAMIQARPIDRWFVRPLRVALRAARGRIGR